jgi:hypothetical protein
MEEWHVHFRILILILAFTAFGLAFPQQAQADRAVHDCRDNGLRVVQSNSPKYTSSGAFQPARGLAVSFRQRVHGCVIVELNTTGSAPDGVLVVKPVLDGDNDDFLGREAQLIVRSSGPAETHTTKFIWPDIPRGPHTLRMYFHSGGGTVSMSNVTMFVHYMR